MKDGLARLQVAGVRADIGFLRDDIRRLQGQIREFEEIFKQLGFKRRDQIPAQWVREEKK